MKTGFWWLGVLGCLCFVAGCGGGADWPPEPKDAREKLLIESALRAVRQYDSWAQVACVLERTGPGEWRVQAWKVVNPEARGRKKCVPWAVRSITLDESGAVTGYANGL